LLFICISSSFSFSPPSSPMNPSPICHHLLHHIIATHHHPIIALLSNQMSLQVS
jgi:hypothetical protein